MRSWRTDLTAARLSAAFIAASAAWAALIIAAPLLASRAHASGVGSALIVVVYGIGSLVCHQLPERSYHLWAAQMPVCARCAGIYLGAMLGAVGARAVRGSRGEGRSAESLALRHARVLLVLAVTPSLVTLVYEWTTGDMPSHLIRAAAGLPIGLAAAWLVVAAADNQVN